MIKKENAFQTKTYLPSSTTPLNKKIKKKNLEN